MENRLVRIEILLGGRSLGIFLHCSDPRSCRKSIVPDIRIGRRTGCFPWVNAIERGFARQVIVVLMRIDVRRRTPLLEIVEAHDALGGRFGTAQPSRE